MPRVRVKGGADTNPDWYYNLKAHPDIQIEVGDETIDVHADEILGAERNSLFKRKPPSTPLSPGTNARPRGPSPSSLSPGGSGNSDGLKNHVLHMYTMRKEILTVRDVDEQEWRRFRAKTAEERLKTGDALTQAMRLWVKERESPEKKPDPKLLLKVKPITIGRKKVRWSEEIDETLYGSNK